MKVERDLAVAVCQNYGLATADGWNDARLSKKLAQMVQLHRSGDHEFDDDLLDDLKRMAVAAKAGEDFEIVDVGPSDEETNEGEERGSPEPASCPLGPDDRVIVSEEGVEPWKGIVDEVLTSERVMVRDRERKIWEVPVDCCRLVKQAADVAKKERPPTKKPPTSEDEELRLLQERLAALKKRRKTAGKLEKAKKSSRDELALKAIKSHGEEGEIDSNLVEEIELRWKKRGGQSNSHASETALKRVVKYGLLFGVVKADGRRIRWIG